MKKRLFCSGSFVAPSLVSLALVMGGTWYTTHDWWRGDDMVVFCKGMLKYPLQTGAFSPCTKFVAQEVVRHINRIDGRPLRILEVGAGIGSLTAKIEEVLQEGDQLDVVEINPDFCEILRKRFGQNPLIKIHCMSILDWDPAYKHDAIISAVPFNMFDISMIENILYKYETIAKEGATLSYIEMMALSDWKGFFKLGAAKEEFKQKRKLLLEFRKKHLIEAVDVYRNVPPVRVYHCKLREDDQD